MKTASLVLTVLLASASAHAHPPASDGAWLGVGLEQTSAAMCAALGRGAGCGVLVGDVTDGTPAHKAGLRVGDLMTKIDGQPLAGPDELMERMDALRPGHRATIDVLRRGKHVRITATLAKREGRGYWSRWRNAARGWLPHRDLDRLLREVPGRGAAPGWRGLPKLEQRMERLERELEQLRKRLGGADGSKTST